MSLIESLVALVVLALGVLGLLGVQLRTMVDNQTANHRTTATRLAEELFERVKTNPANFVNPTAPLAAASWAWTANYANAWGNLPAAVDCTNANCTNVQRAQADLNAWKTSVRSSGLPGGEAVVLASPNTGSPRQLIVIIGWRTKEADTGNSSQNDALAAPFAINIAGVAAPAACGTTHICYAAYGQP